MGFAVAADAYDRFMGRFSEQLAPVFADFASVTGGMRVVDVGCGTGALTAELAARLDADGVAAADPAPQFAEACRARVPDVDVRHAPGEQLPFEDEAFDVALAQLVVTFMRDAEAGVGEMRRVVRPGGTVALCSWAAREHQMLGLVWSAAEEAAGGPRNTEDSMRYRTRDDLLGLASGLEAVEAEKLTVEASYEGFGDFWGAIETAAGPVGDYVERLDDEGRAALRAACARRVPADGPFSLSAAAWAVRGRR